MIGFLSLPIRTTEIVHGERIMQNADFKNKIVFVNVIITSRCQATCSYCAYWRIPPQDLDIKTFCFLIEHLSRETTIKGVLLTGGEPMLHPQFKQFLEVLRYNGIPAILNTNGWKLDTLSVEDLSGVHSIVVSLDTWDSENYMTIRGHRMHERIVYGIQYVRELSPEVPITVSCLIQRKNLPYLKDMYGFAKNIGASALSLLVPSFEEYGFGWERYGNPPQSAPLTQEEIRKLEESLKDVEKLENGQNRFLNQSQEILAEYIQYFRMLAGLPFYLPRHDCLVPITTVTVTERGTLKPCFYLPHEFPWSSGKSPLSLEAMSSFRSNFRKQFKQCQTCMQFLCNEWIRPLADPPVRFES